jgi:flavin-dependent dehydrogenase
MMTTPSKEPWDVIVVGGALSGAATAILLLRRNPRLRILILERAAEFSRRVGESTVEVSAYFLGRVLGLTEHLNQHHLTKQGMRFWFTNHRVRNLGDCSETGPRYNVRFPGYQVDRAVLDQEVLDRAVAAGATLFRPVNVRDITLAAGGQQTVTWETASDASASPSSTTATARWVVDASGFASLLARKNGWFTPNTAHPIAACWSRWQGVKNLDSRELAEKFPAFAQRANGVRYTATNHIVGLGWWSWWIPLKGGDFSVGIVYDQRITELQPGGKLGDRLKEFLNVHPAARELLTDATFQTGDVHFRRNCAYVSSTFAGDGFTLVGDAAAFIDPFYSPGMDWIAFTATATAHLLDGCLRGRPAAERVARHNERFHLSYSRWFDSIYRDKYYYMGDHELMTLAFRLDLGLYYIGIVSQPFKNGESALEIPAFAGRGSGRAAQLLSLYNRRLAAIARRRLAVGTWGRKNAGNYFPFMSYQLDRRLPWRVLWALVMWGKLELTEGWRTWFAAPAITSSDVKRSSRGRPQSFPAPAATSPQPIRPLTATEA